MTANVSALERVLLLGGTSEIGLATVNALPLAADATVYLAGRDTEALRAAASRLAVDAQIETFDALDISGHRAMLDRVAGEGPLDLVLVAFGILGDQARAERDIDHALEIIDIDLRAQISVLLAAADLCRRQGAGSIVVFSSIAASRPRRANFVYGAAKAGLDAFANGLADSLCGTGVRVIVARPGFVVGRMTAGMPVAPWPTTPEAVGRAVANAVVRGKTTVWVPRRLAFVAWLIRFVPRPLWRRIRR